MTETRMEKRLAYAQGKAESEHRLYERAEKGRKAAQARVVELEKQVRDAWHWMMANKDVEVHRELRRILGRTGGNTKPREEVPDDTAQVDDHD